MRRGKLGWGRCYPFGRGMHCSLRHTIKLL